MFRTGIMYEKLGENNFAFIETSAFLFFLINL